MLKMLVSLAGWWWVPAPQAELGMPVSSKHSDGDGGALAESALQLVRSVCGTAQGTGLGRWQHTAGGETTIDHNSYLSKSLVQYARLHCLG